MKKKNLAVLATAVTMIAALAVGVSACKSKKENDNTNDDVTTESTTEEETTTEEDTEQTSEEDSDVQEESSTIAETSKKEDGTTLDQESVNESVVQDNASKAAEDAKAQESTQTTTTVAATTKAPTAAEYSWSGYYESEGNAGSTQFHIKKSGSGFEISGDGIDGDKYGEISGALVKVNNSTYKYQGENGSLTLRYKNGTITVKQSGTVGDEGFDFSGTYQKTRTTEE